MFSLTFIATLLQILPTNLTAIENVQIATGDGATLAQATVLMEQGKIRAVGRNVALPRGTKRIDGTGKILTPGLIESVTQLGLIEVDLESSTRDFRLDGQAFSPGFRVADGFNPLSPRIPINREEGVTSAILNPTGGLIHGTGSWIDLTGWLETAPNPGSPTAMFATVTAHSKGYAGGARGGVWLRFREAFSDARFYQKNRNRYERGESRELSLTPVHLEALIPVLEGKIPLVMHVNRATDILTALRFAKSERIRLVLAGGLEAWMIASELAEAQIPVILKPSAQTPTSFDALAARDDAPKLLANAGVPLIISSMDWDNNIRRLRQEAGIAVAYGLSPQDALRAITSTPAKIFGRGASVGAIRTGKRANVVLWSGDPFELSTVVLGMWIDGQKMHLDNRQRQLARRYKRERTAP